MMAFKDFLNQHIESQAAAKNGGFVEFGYGQVEPNHLSAQRTAQIYAQLPAAADIDVLEQGQFVKYDYANEVCDFTGAGEWMLVYNEIKLYREGQWDCEFAMVKDNYEARIYSPFDWTTEKTIQSRYYNGVDANGNTSITVGSNTYDFDDVTAEGDYYEPYYNNDPYKHLNGRYKEKKMPQGTKMVPRVLKTNPGDIYTTNMVMETTLAVDDRLTPQAGTAGKGILAKAGANNADMVWQVVKVYTMPDGQAGVKIMRIK
jgi:hypothetical protein